MNKFIWVLVLLTNTVWGQGRIVSDSLESDILKDNRIQLDARRRVSVYLPPGYGQSGKTYPVVYYFHSIGMTAVRFVKESGIASLLDSAFVRDRGRAFILVVPDCSGPTTGSMYENSGTTGRWLDYITQELVPYIDGHYRTKSGSGSRAVTGEYFGGRGALMLAMTRPDLFGSVYALHPVATGMGALPWTYTDINWGKISTAKRFDELAGLGFTQIFVAIQQAFAPNPAKPPFYCDWMYDRVEGEMRVNTAVMKRVKDGFLLDRNLEANKDRLKQLKAIAYDWGRFDPVQEHVISAANLSRQLTDLGIVYEAEEYAGVPWNKNWGEWGRFRTRVLPFLSRWLDY